MSGFLSTLSSTSTVVGGVVTGIFGLGIAGSLVLRRRVHGKWIDCANLSGRGLRPLNGSANVPVTSMCCGPVSTVLEDEIRRREDAAGTPSLKDNRVDGSNNTKFTNNSGAGAGGTSAVPIPHLVVITGGNVGLGHEAARDLAKRGARVVIGCRNQEAGKRAEEEIRREVNLMENNSEIQANNTAGISNSITSLPLDLTSAESIRDFARSVAQMRNDMNRDVPTGSSQTFNTEFTLVCNAGVWIPPEKQEEIREARAAKLKAAASNSNTSNNDNIVANLETHFTTNHLGHFLLVRELLGEEAFRGPEGEKNVDVSSSRSRTRVVVVGSGLMKSGDLSAFDRVGSMNEFWEKLKGRISKDQTNTDTGNTKLEDLLLSGRSRTDLKDNAKGSTPSPWVPLGYADSKLMNALFVHELAKRVKASNSIEVLGVCPGWCDTRLARHVEQDGSVITRKAIINENKTNPSAAASDSNSDGASAHARSASSPQPSSSSSLNPLKKLGLYFARSMFQRSAREGAQNIVFTVVEEKISEEGVFYRDGGVDKEMGEKLRRAAEKERDIDDGGVSQKLWDLSNLMCDDWVKA